MAYRVKPSGKNDWVKRRASGQQFVASFVQHILPSGFQKVRYYGWMSPNCKLQLEGIRWLIWLYLGWTYWLGSGVAQPKIDEPAGPTCSHCGGELEVQIITDPHGLTLWRRLPARGPPCAA